MQNSQLPSDLQRFNFRVAETLAAAESGETHVEGEPVLTILTKARTKYGALLHSKDSLLAATAAEQLRRIDAVLMGIAA